MQSFHGGDVYSYREQYGHMPVDLSANINPYPIPVSVRQAIRAAIERCNCYPDPFCRAARRAISRREHIPANWIYCGNGAADVLDRLALALRPHTVLLAVPTFPEYRRTLPDCTIQNYALRPEEGFLVTERILQALSPALDAVYLCNPNNPTGRTVPPALLHEIIRQCAASHTRVIIDECFVDFLTHPETHTLTGLLEAYPNLILLRSYTKLYAIPGIRFGWCMTSDTGLTEKLYRVGQPWNVSVIAQACAVAAANELSYARECAQKTATERLYLQERLIQMGYWVCPGEANFLLFRDHTSGDTLAGWLARHGILIRSCKDFDGLQTGYYRTAVKTREESDTLLYWLERKAGAS